MSFLDPLGLFKDPKQVEAAKSPDYGQSMQNVLNAQKNLAPQQLALEQQYQPQYQTLQSNLEAQASNSQLDLYKQLQPKYSQLEDAYSRQNQLNQTQALQERAPAYVQAYQQASGTAGINQQLQDYARMQLSPQLQRGFSLSPEEQRTIDQQSLRSYAARGTALGSQAGLSGVLNRYNFSRQRENEYLQKASSLGNYFGQQSAPAMAGFYGQSAYASTAATPTIPGALMSQQQAGPSMFNPESQQGMGAIFGAYNSENQVNMANAQAQAGAQAGKRQAAGSVAGAAAVAAVCWVARACFGSDTDRWKQFRNSMFKNASDKFISWYCRNGEKLAARIEKSEIAKAIGRITLTALQAKWTIQN